MSEKENKENQVKETAGTKKEEKVIKEVKKETIKEPEAVEVKKENKTGVKQVEKKEDKKTENDNNKQDKKKFEVKTTKQQNNKTGDTKKASWIAPTITILLVLVVVALLTVMIVTSSDPKKTVDGFLTNLKSGDFTKAQEFVSENKDILSDEKFDQETEALLFDKMSWKITKITKEDDKANVEIEITNKNFDTIISNCMKKLLGDFKSVLSGSSVEKNMEKYLTEELKNEQPEMKTVTKTIELVKEDKKWKVVSNDELIDSLLPGFQEAINELEQEQILIIFNIKSPNTILVNSIRTFAFYRVFI